MENLSISSVTISFFLFVSLRCHFLLLFLIFFFSFSFSIIRQRIFAHCEMWLLIIQLSRMMRHFARTLRTMKDAIFRYSKYSFGLLNVLFSFSFSFSDFFFRAFLPRDRLIDDTRGSGTVRWPCLNSLTTSASVKRTYRQHERHNFTARQLNRNINKSTLIIRRRCRGRKRLRQRAENSHFVLTHRKKSSGCEFPLSETEKFESFVCKPMWWATFVLAEFLRIHNLNFPHNKRWKKRIQWFN